MCIKKGVFRRGKKMDDKCGNVPQPTKLFYVFKSITGENGGCKKDDQDVVNNRLNGLQKDQLNIIIYDVFFVSHLYLSLINNS
jgi:hypothetical protein